MYTADDPRSTLAQKGTQAALQIGARPAQFIEFHSYPATFESELGSPSWVARSQNLVLVWTEGKVGDSWVTESEVGYMVLLPNSGCAELDVRHGEGAEVVAEGALICVPPGTSTVTVLRDGSLCRLVPVDDAPELAEQALNAAAYQQPDPLVAVAELGAAPAARGLAVYRLGDHKIEDSLFGRIFRDRSIMVNFLPEQVGPRDPTRLSPHHHDDFEQVSLVVTGDYVHHIRYPWSTDSTAWRSDEHHRVGSPSIAIIPPPAIHTSEAVGDYHELIDIFSPPRVDFGEANWVRNASDYPSEGGRA